jgi:hydrogenase expression/formation protein HypE
MSKRGIAEIASEGFIRLVHGGGGSFSHMLVEEVFLPAFGNPELNLLNDSAVVEVPSGPLAYTTDSFVVDPLFFPGGDIGRLAVCGTVNDLAVVGAKPLALTAGFILEEGLAFDVLRRITRSMKTAADEAGIRIVAGDTKVVQKGKGDGIFISMSGIGIFEGDRRPISGSGAQPGDDVVLSGPIGRHGLAVLLSREDLGLRNAPESDVSPLNGLVASALDSVPDIHAMRDATRGGLGVVLNEIAQQSGVGIEIDEEAVPVPEEVRGACELLGFDPLYLANEGVLIAFAGAARSKALVGAMKKSPYGVEAAVIGRVSGEPKGKVFLKTGIGSRRIVDWISGEQLPRIC